MRYNKYCRWFLVRLCNYVPRKIEDKLLDYLYPDDLIISFKGKDNE